MNYYNEFDLEVAAWLQELINCGLIPNGDVDTRSITEIKPHELTHYIQCHFFAGIGGWSLALQLAGWSPDTPVWTGSCPCQPFSSAGNNLGTEDERHLWPIFFNLINECRPQHVFGEQVANAVGAGWLDGVSTDLEKADYTCGSVVLGAHSVGAPHIRQRIYWGACGVGDTKQQGPQGHTRSGAGIGEQGWVNAEEGGSGVPAGNVPDWTGCSVIPCLDGKQRRIPSEPAFFPLAPRVPARMVRLRGYGNAIVPQVAAEFITAFTEETKIFTKSLDV
jgi:DNA (cytosine-5)-methyltransferase 1